MFLKDRITTFTENSLEETAKLKEALQSAETIVVGAGAGLSESSGLSYSGERFDRYFSDFRDKYGIRDMYVGGFYPYNTENEYWAWWSRHILYNRYETTAGKAYTDLLELLASKDYFVLTTNVDHQFQKAGFDKKRLFYTQGDYGLWQCVNGCGNKTFDNREQVKKMVDEQREMKVPDKLIPHCPICGKHMTMNLRCDAGFVEDNGFFAAARRYEEFLEQHKNLKILFLELGVGGNTPGIIKYPFLKMTLQNPNASYACINKGEAFTADEIKERSIIINDDIENVLSGIMPL